MGFPPYSSAAGPESSSSARRSSPRPGHRLERALAIPPNGERLVIHPLAAALNAAPAIGAATAGAGGLHSPPSGTAEDRGGHAGSSTDDGDAGGAGGGVPPSTPTTDGGGSVVPGPASVAGEPRGDGGGQAPSTPSTNVGDTVAAGTLEEGGEHFAAAAYQGAGDVAPPDASADVECIDVDKEEPPPQKRT
eukprot:TRINITY_DN1173_c0_g1_i4.p1 TRINITY_DN1173_c0_g1~~TRINITY_DN1173_c0_g1_i4.p1  ORF type:complete len:219 (+),score=37.95 TRINITY_DN1173_c0_g1_i4:87-659(+)